ncbi:pathogeneis protein 1B [Trichuris trichiura]|uniref:Pathogeneis protein 1B n=1 Tax=Trichuris trichiura TaxID=36087 RepID=A0A077Z7U6_TRITR|nr:pathogeneis protein 1B [Trichuris trichiura]
MQFYCILHILPEFLLLTYAVGSRAISIQYDVTPLPFNTLQQGRFVWAFNQFRSRLNSGNMQCITMWNTDLAEYAQKMAETCSVTKLEEDVEKYGIVMVTRPFMHDVPTAAELVEHFYMSGKGNYNYEENVCNDENPSECANFKQFAWHAGSEIGCGMARCEFIIGKETAGYLVVCAMNKKASMRHPPYAPGPSCVHCPVENSRCVNGLCCPMDWQKAPIKRCNGKPNDKHMMAVHRFYNHGTSTNLLVTDTEQVDFLKRQGMPYKGIVGRVSRSEDKSCPHLMPVHHMYSDTFSGDYYTSDEMIYNGRINREAQDFGVIGYAVAGPGICDATVPIYEFYHKMGIIQLQNSTELQKLLDDDRGGFSYRGISFAIWP